MTIINEESTFDFLKVWGYTENTNYDQIVEVLVQVLESDLLDQHETMEVVAYDKDNYAYGIEYKKLYLGDRDIVVWSVFGGINGLYTPDWDDTKKSVIEPLQFLIENHKIETYSIKLN